ncbi:metallophosphoesterase [Pseudomonas sp. S2_C03]
MLKPLHSPAVKSYELNLDGHDFVVGDIHGYFNLLTSLLEQAEFDETRDRLFSVGDLIDRGPYSDEVIVWLKQPWFHAVRGNHEQMIVECSIGIGDVPRHIRNGGAWFHEAPSASRQGIFDVLNDLPIMLEIERPDRGKVGIVHAEVPTLLPSDGWPQAKAYLAGHVGEELQQQALKCALYSRNKIENRDHSIVEGIDTVYVGHSTVTDVTNLGNVVFTDTGCSFGDGALSLININTGAVFRTAMTAQ